MEFKQLIKIDRSKINDELAQFMEQRYSLGLKVEKAYDKLEIAKNILENSTATLASEYKVKYKRSGMKLTTTDIDRMVKANKKTQGFKEEVRKANKVLRLCKLRLSVFQDKFKAMEIICNNIRADGKSIR